MTLIVRLLSRFIFPHPWLVFLVMVSCFGLFGAGTLNLFHMFSDNWDMLTRNAWNAGSIWQLVELLLTLLLAMFFYTIFKVCEYELVHSLRQPAEKNH